MRIFVAPGDELIVNLEGTDGEFKIRYSPTSLSIEADLPDTQGREGLVYEEVFTTPGKPKVQSNIDR